MHYKNGAPVKEFDRVIFRGGYPETIRTGTIFNLNEGADACNGTVATVTPGGTHDLCVTVGQCYSAEEAYAAMDVQTAAQQNGGASPS
jgi:hypothetical protein